MKVYVVYCHPAPESFTAAVRDRAVDALRTAGHQVRISDLYAEDFAPEMSSQERRDNRAQAEVRRPPTERKAGIADYYERLRWCEALVLIYPTWWSGQPAMLKGWLDRVLLVHSRACESVDGARLFTAQLTNVRRLIGITTHGSSRFVNMLEGQTGRRTIGRSVRVLSHRFARTTWLALYGIDRSTPERREAFLDRVEKRLRRL